ncbi:MAG: ABC transporter permease, partial [Rhodoferax sp.]|nr:ABC transporter permease [Rhodoferax sp.]
MPVQLQEATPRITHQQLAAGSIAQVQGRWTAARMADPMAWSQLQASLSQLKNVPAGELQWDLRRLQRLDHTGAQLLWNSWGRQWPQVLQAEAPQRAMLERVAKYTVAPLAPERNEVWQQYLGLGRRVLRALEHLRDLTRLLGHLALDLVRLARAPRVGPWRDVSGHIYHIGATALPITALVGFLIGVVLAYLMAQQLRQFGADAFIVNILGIALIRELGPVLAAILVA